MGSGRDEQPVPAFRLRGVRQRKAGTVVIDGLMVVGIVSLPGMIAGQIIAGSSPLTAVRFQIVLMFMLPSSVAITATLVTLWYRRTFFTTLERVRAE